MYELQLPHINRWNKHCHMWRWKTKKRHTRHGSVITTPTRMLGGTKGDLLSLQVSSAVAWGSASHRQFLRTFLAKWASEMFLVCVLNRFAAFLGNMSFLIYVDFHWPWSWFDHEMKVAWNIASSTILMLFCFQTEFLGVRGWHWFCHQEFFLGCFFLGGEKPLWSTLSFPFVCSVVYFELFKKFPALWEIKEEGVNFQK